MEDWDKVKRKSLRTSTIVLSSVLAIGGFEAINQVPVAKAASLPVMLTANSFINKINGYASELAAKNDLYASVMMAQAVLESGWGRSTLAQEPYNNLFGIKGNYNGNSVSLNTLEDDGSGNYYQIRDGFRAYPSYYESLSDYVNVIKNGPSWNSSYYSGAWKSNTNSYQDATAWLTGRYATDTSYASKLNTIIQNYQLTQYDSDSASVGTNRVETANRTNITSTETNSSESSNSRSYTVKPGDGLWTVSRHLGISVDELKAQYGLTSNLIHPGQVFSTSGTSGTENNVGTTHVETTTTNSSGRSYTVKPGDGLWTVSRHLGISIDELKAKYGLTSNLIHPGQVFSTSGTSSTANVGSTNNVGTTHVETTTTTTSSSGRSYTVKPGDGLWTVSRHLGISIDELKAKYGLTSNLIHPGQVFSTSGTSGTANNVDTTNVETTTTTTSSNGRSYTVKPGDGLWTVSRHLGISIDELKAQYGLTSNLIHPGQVFSTSGTSSTANAETTSRTSTPSVSASQNTMGNENSYTVQSGDTLWRIATKHGMSVAEVQKLNNLSSTMLYVGQTLTLSALNQSNSQESVTTQSQSTATSQQTSHTSGQYTIKSGDNLYRIALNHGVTLEKLLEANHFSSSNQLILPGQSLIIPN